MNGRRSTTMAVITVSLLVGSGLGVAAQGEDAEAMAPSFFSGTTDDWSTIAEPAIACRNQQQSFNRTATITIEFLPSSAPSGGPRFRLSGEGEHPTPTA